MDKIFADHIRDRHLIIYMDNMFIHTSNLLINTACTKKALEQLQENNLYAKLEKFVF